MCGFAGLAFANVSRVERLGLTPAHFEECARRVAHRGGDGEGIATLAHVWLAHHRLAFQDVRAGGQPFFSSDGDAAILFNGEIYNHLALRSVLTAKWGMHFGTRSDTETLVEGVRLEGESFLEAVDGEYAFVVAQQQGRRIRGFRDAFGVKPLFLYLEDVDTATFAEARAEYEVRTPLLAFASEMKALPLSLKWNREGALRQFVGLFEPLRTPFENVIALPAGARFDARLEGSGEECHYVVRVTLPEVPVRDEAGGRLHFRQEEDERDFEAIAEEFATHFAEGVTARLLSDVELGVYLSGGVDSKAVGYELSRHLRARGLPRLKSFTIGFAERAFDETQEALAFARDQGFEAHALEVDAAALAYSYPIAVAHSENLQPYTNGAAKWWLSRFARTHVHGVLTGDGADELLCGYPSFRYCAWWKFAARGSEWRKDVYKKRFLAHAENPWLAGSSSAGGGADFLQSLAMWGVAHPLFGQVRAIARTLFPSDESADAWLQAQGPSVRSWFLFGFRGTTDVSLPANALLAWQNYFCRTHLPVQVLNWVGDRMEMANTLEGRTPFLSRGLRTFVRSLPDAALVAGFTDKAILRKAYVPRLGAFARTPKKQFGAPFLDNATLLARHPAHAALEALGLDADAVQRRLQPTSAVSTNVSPAEDAYERTHRESALQTLVSLGIVHATLVGGESISRDRAYEDSILRTEKVFP